MGVFVAFNSFLWLCRRLFGGSSFCWLYMVWLLFGGFAGVFWWLRVLLVLYRILLMFFFVFFLNSDLLKGAWEEII